MTPQRALSFIQGQISERQRGCSCNVECSMGIRILEGTIVGAGRGDGDEEGEKPEDFWGSCREHPRTA
jgi:hypothetical protein